MSAVRLICFDLDGTLIDSQNQVHPRVWQAAQEAQAAGLHLAICTGRPALGQTLPSWSPTSRWVGQLLP